MEFKCERCGYSSIYKSALLNHLNKKNICKPILSNKNRDELIKNFKPTYIKKLQCSKCDKEFSSKSSLSTHKKVCKINLLKTFELQIKEMKEQIKLLEKKTKSTGNTTINNTVNNTININAYGTHKPTINYEQFEKLLRIGAYKAIKTLIDVNHFNRDRPENMNFYISNYKDNIGRIFDGESWIIKDGDHLVDEIYDLYQTLVDSVIEDLQDSSDEERNKIEEKMSNAIELWCKRTNNNKFINGIKEDLKKHFHGKKEIVKKIHNIK